MTAQTSYIRTDTTPLNLKIIAEAEKLCLAKTGSTMSSYGVVVVEDDFGNVVFFTEGCTELFIAPAATDQATTDYLPMEARLTHRKIHRQAIKDPVLTQHSFVADSEHWTAELRPCTAGKETSTLSLFSRTE